MGVSNAMTEAEWLVCDDLRLMLDFLRDKASERKLRLFAVGCCRRLWGLLINEQSRRAIEVAERLADGLASEMERRSAYRGAESICFEATTAIRAYEKTGQTVPIPMTLAKAVARLPLGAAHLVPSGFATARDAVEAIIITSGADAGQQERFSQIALLREIIGNPFRPASFNSAWLAPQALAVARSIYEDGRWKDLPVVADSLEETGCTDNDILAHCHGPGPHVRGCWVLDLILGKM
jgi:hypothetical protein